MNSREVSNTDDVIDSRDVIARIEELQSAADAAEEGSGTEESAAAWAAENPDEAEELATLLALQEEAQGSPDWQHGETLIRGSYFRDYAEQLADDIGAINREARWPNNCIDWERAADELKVDYFSVDFGGVEYWVRS